MAKTLRTSGDYTIKAGAGTAGTNQIDFDSKTVRVRGDLIVDGDQTIVNTATLSVEDTFVELARNNSGAALDAGIYVNRGTAGNNSVFYWDESEDSFKAATTTDGAGVSPLTSATLANVRVAEPADNSDAATKNYVDTELSAVASVNLNIVGDDSTGVTINNNEYLQITGGSNIGVVVSEPFLWGTVTINLNNDLTNITSITSTASNSNLTLKANGTGSIAVDNILTFTSSATTPTAGSITKIYNKTVGSGGTGVFFVNSTVDSGAEGELISKKKARAYAIALG
jgi:hypothetical protein